MSDKMQQEFWVTEGTIPAEPVEIKGFDPSRDVIGIAGLGISRADLQFTQQGEDTLITINGEAVKQATEKISLAVVKGIHPYDLDPAALVKQTYAAFGRGDLPAALATLAEDVVWELPGPPDIIPWAGKHTGRDSVARALGAMYETVETKSFVPQSFMTQGNTVAVVIEEESTARKSGQSYKAWIVHLIRVNQGKISHLQSFSDTFDMVEAILGGRPFTVPAATGVTSYVPIPLVSDRVHDCFAFDRAELLQDPKPTRVAKEQYGALKRVDMPAMKAIMADNAIWEIFGPPDILSWAGIFHGPDGTVDSVLKIMGTLQFQAFEPRHFIAQGDSVAVIIFEQGICKATGVSFTDSVVHIISANEEGKATLFRNYINTFQVVEAFQGGRPFTVGKVE